MTADRIIGAVFFGVLALLLAVYVSFTVRGKGPILSNGWIFLTAEQKKREDKRPHYRLVSVVFGCLAGTFALGAVNILTDWVWAAILSGVLILFALVYAIADAVRTEKHRKY